MLTQPQVQRYAVESGLRDIMIAEKEVVLTFLLQLLSERGILDRLAFKGGTCLRKMFLGSHGRFSTDLDFTGIEEHDHEDVIIAMMEPLNSHFTGFSSGFPMQVITKRSTVCPGVSILSHDWNQGGSEIRLQISRGETPTLPPERRAQIEQSYFRFLPFVPAEFICLALPEILAEKIRACYQRSKARDIYDLGMFASRPIDHALIRRLVVLKLWQARDSFDPARLIQKFQNGRDFDWDDLRDLLRRTIVIDRDRITADCARGFAFLPELTEDELVLAADQHQRQQAVADRLRAVPAQA